MSCIFFQVSQMVLLVFVMLPISWIAVAEEKSKESEVKLEQSPNQLTTDQLAEVEALKKKHQCDNVFFIPATKTPPVIDGAIEDIWKQSPAHRFTWQHAKELKRDGVLLDRHAVSPQAKTDAYMLCDENNLYVFFVCWADVSKLRGSKNVKPVKVDKEKPWFEINTDEQRRNISGSCECVEIILDTTHSRRQGYQFRFEPHGTFSDVIYHPKHSGAGNDWGEYAPWNSQGMEYATVIGKDAWFVEVKIPFATIDVAPGKALRVWGVSLNRLSRNPTEDTSIFFTDRAANARFDRLFPRAILEVGK